MKLKNIFLILFLCCTSLCFAQDKLFEKYADMDNVTSVFISKKMFDMIPNVESGGLNLMNLKGKINNLHKRYSAEYTVLRRIIFIAAKNARC